jgi:spore maturation protein CgeB
MRIFYASDKTPNASIASNLWRNNLLLPLRDLGHEVVEFDYDFGGTFRNLDPAQPEQREFIRRNRPRLSAALLEQIEAAHKARPIDLFFSYFYDACVLPETIDRVRALGIRTVNWYCNGSYQLHLASEISPHYDWCLVPEKFRMEDYRRMGARPIYCQEAANPNIYKPYDVPQDLGVTFIGQAYGDRPAAIRRLIERGIDVRVWGFGWRALSEDAPAPPASARLARIARKLLTPGGQRAAWEKLKTRLSAAARPSAAPAPVLLPSRVLGGVLDDAEMIRTYSRSKINLGFSTCGDTHLTKERILQVRLRDFEVPMSGGFYMVEYMEELEEFFEIGKEIVCYRDFEDLADKVTYYLAHDSERERIRRAGHERCKRDHSWQRRFERAFAEMALA